MDEEEKDTKKVGKRIVVSDDCIGCGTCEQIAPDYFKVEGISTVIKDYNEADADKIADAIESCPVDAISLVEIKEKKKDE